MFAAATGNVVPLLRFRYIQPAASPAGEFNGGYVPLAVDVRDVSGNVIVAGTDGEMMMPPLKVIGFSCSSKRTISVMARNPFEEGGVVQVTGPVRPSRQILKSVLNDVAPPWM